ncbi:WD repeat-containing protein 75-like [Tubulanus polymorphus]|uniref:WD repeat-containing protein 75-like n=1 Tax=Tubulanus polymorphus TaxID=672921 RepID=UPI003DA25C55
MDENKSNKVIVSLKGGSSFVSYRPIFSHDSKYLFCCCGNVVQVLNVESGECVHRLRKHQNTVTAVKLNPLNYLQLYSSGLDGQLVLWDYLDAVVLKTFDLKLPIFSFSPLGLMTLETGRQAEFLVAVRADKSAHIAKVQLPSKREGKPKIIELMRNVSKSDKMSAVRLNGEFVVSVKPRCLSIQWLKKDKFIEHKLVKEHTNTRMSCVACHPSDSCIATGCDDGIILLWWHFSRSERVVKSIYQWHALPVGDIQFTVEGSYMMSGGQESVLVKWQHNASSNDKHSRQFLPRLGAPVCYVTTSPDNACYATCHSDNEIKIITNLMTIKQVVQGLTIGHAGTIKRNPLPAGLHIDPRTKALVSNGKLGHLQFYNLQNDKQLYNLDIVCQNYVSSTSRDRAMIVTELENVAFDASGNWLATVEHWHDASEEFSREFRLKFWRFDAATQRYALNTVIDMPHDDRINSLKFRPTLNKDDDAATVVTTSADGRFKLWSLVDDTDIYRKNQCWNCESVGFYRRMKASDGDFSEDGSILAVAFESVLTLWDPDTDVLRKTFDCLENISCVKFGRKTSAQRIVVVTTNHLYVWNIPTCTVSWKVSLNVRRLVSDPESEHMAVFTQSLDVHVFTPSNPKPVYSHLKATTEDVIGAIFVPQSAESNAAAFDKDSPLSWQRHSRLYFMTKSQHLLTLNSATTESRTESADADSDNATTVSNFVNAKATNVPTTPFNQLLARTKKTGVVAAKPELLVGKIGGKRNEILDDMLMTPAHVLPSVTVLCNTFLHSTMLNKSFESSSKNRTEKDDEDDENGNSDSDMEVDDDDEPSRESRQRQTETKNSQQTETDCSQQTDSAADVDNKLTRKLPRPKTFQWLRKTLSTKT